jgi:hypothetical protein
MVFNAQRDLEPQLGAEDRRSYQSELKHLFPEDSAEARNARLEKNWGHLLGSSSPGIDAQGRPILRIQKGDEVVNVGIAGGNIFADAAADQFTQQLLEARLHAELRRGSPRASESDVERDWNLLQKSLNSQTEADAQPHRTMQGGGQVRAGNRP